jgi:hypothetical protein
MSRAALISALCGIGVVALAAVGAPRPATTTAALTENDYAEIQQLVARYPYAFDSGADDGYGCARLFTEDGTFMFGNRTVAGREKLAAFVKGDSRGDRPSATHIFTTNVIIKPTPGGATGKAYVVSLDIGDPSKPSAIHGGGHYEDVYVKTSEGWRFKKRAYIVSKKGPSTETATPPSVVGTGAVHSEAKAASSTNLTPRDYVEIKQLVVRSAYAMDTGADSGYAYADLFTGDGEFVAPQARGREQLAALARGGARGPAFAHQYLMNYVIEPSPEGARGRQYVVEINIDDDPPSKHLNGRSEWDMVGVKGGEITTTAGHYEDVYVKTAQGWRFKKRAFFASTAGNATASIWSPPVAMFAAGGGAGRHETARSLGASSLTPMDYIEIEQLVANYGYALDTGADHGYAYADNFAPDGVVFGQIKWREPMAELQRKQVFGPNFVRHFLTNMQIEPTPDGAKGKNYLVVLDIGEGGKPSSIYIGGHYEDTYEKTADGWRFRTRTLIYSKTGQPAALSQ